MYLEYHGFWPHGPKSMIQDSCQLGGIMDLEYHIPISCVKEVLLRDTVETIYRVTGYRLNPDIG